MACDLCRAVVDQLLCQPCAEMVMRLIRISGYTAPLPVLPCSPATTPSGKLLPGSQDKRTTEEMKKDKRVRKAAAGKSE